MSLATETGGTPWLGALEDAVHYVREGELWRVTEREVRSDGSVTERSWLQKNDPRLIKIAIALCALGTSNARCGRDHFPDCQVSGCRP